jgi:succinoglycan biosynthesis protein ExoO
MTNGARPKVTVIIPVYNSARTLERAIRSVLSQTLPDFQLLVIDDGSADDSALVANRLAAEDSRITLVKLAQNGGKARAMNMAIGMTQADWVSVLDADDRYLPTRLQTLVQAGETQGVDLVADNQLHTDDATGEIHRQAFTQPGPGRRVGMADFIRHSDTTAPFDFGILKPMLRVDFIRRTGLAYHPTAKLAEDFYYLVDFFVAGGQGWLVHEPLYEWTLPFSPTGRRWTNTGSGAWRYDYRNALETNRHFLEKLSPADHPELYALLRRRQREYDVMVHYLGAQRILADQGDYRRAFAIIASHPGTWKLLGRRITGRLARAAGRLRRRAPSRENA